MSLVSVDFDHGNEIFMYGNIGFDINFARKGFLQVLKLENKFCAL